MKLKNIEGQEPKRLQELSVITLLLVFSIFVNSWFFDLMHEFKEESATHSDLLFWDLNYTVTLFIVSLVFLLGIVWYFWRLRNTPQFHILFIERKEERKQINTKRFFRLFLIPVGISTGLSFTILSYETLPLGYWWSPGHTFLWNFEHSPLPYYPLILVVCSSTVFYYAYRIKPERVQKWAPWLLSIPIILSATFSRAFNLISGFFSRLIGRDAASLKFTKVDFWSILNSFLHKSTNPK